MCTLRGVTRNEKNQNPKNFFTRDVVATGPKKKLTTGIVVSDTEDLEATDASDRVLTSALCGALPSMPTLLVDERPWLSLSVPVRDVDDESQTSRTEHAQTIFGCAWSAKTLSRRAKKSRADGAAGQTASPQHNFQMASHVPPNVALPYTDVIETATVLKRPLGVSRRPESQPYQQMWYKRYRAASTWRRVGRQADGNLNKHRCLKSS